MSDCTFLGLSPQEWEIINGFANWLAAIGTIAAVVVSLWLARRQDKPRGNIWADVSPVYFSKNSPNNRTYLIVKAVNVGDRPITVTHLSLSFGLFKKVYVAIPKACPEISALLPVELPYGKEVEWYIPLETEQFKWVDNVAKHIIESHPRVHVRAVRVHAYTASGHVLESKPDVSVASAFEQACERIRSTVG